MVFVLRNKTDDYLRIPDVSRTTSHIRIICINYYYYFEGSSPTLLKTCGTM